MKLRWLIIGAILVSGLIWAYWYLINKAEPAASQAMAALYNPVAVTRGDVTLIVDASGEMVPALTTDLFPGKEGRVASVAVIAGDSVKKGQVLMRITPSESETAEAKANYNQEKLKADALKDEYERTQKLYQLQGVTGQQLDTAKKDYLMQLERLNTAQVRLGQLCVSSATDLVAPYDGIVTEVHAKIGAYATQQSTLLTMIDPRRLLAEVEVDENDIAQVKPGQAAIILLDAFPDQEFKGAVVSVGELGKTQGGVVLFKVKVSLTDPSYRVKPGMSADAGIIIHNRANVIIVPNTSVETRMGKTTARMYIQDSGLISAKFRQVTVGMHNETVTEIIEGLREGEQVAVPVSRKNKAGE